PADKGEVKFGKVVEIIEDGKDEGGSVVLEGGQSIRYSVLVLATGNLWNGPMDIPDDKKGIQGLFDSWRAKFEKAQNIGLVGGGAVGIGSSPLLSFLVSLCLLSFRVCWRDQRLLPYQESHHCPGREQTSQRHLS